MNDGLGLCSLAVLYHLGDALLNITVVVDVNSLHSLGLGIHIKPPNLVG